MKRHGRLFTRPWIVLAAVVVLLAGHVVLYQVLRHTVLSAALVSSLVILVVIKHLGLLSPLYALFRRRTRQ
jgi:uncharacterized membrane protein